MSDLIDRQAAIDCVTYDYEYVIECLEKLPSVQPQNVTRCKDCKFVFRDDGWDNLWCERVNDSFAVERDGFCAWGKMEVNDAQEDEIESRKFDIFDCSSRTVKCIAKYDTSPYSYDYDLLEIGKEYTVAVVFVFDYYTMIMLKEFPGKRFNSVLFAEVDNK